MSWFTGNKMIFTALQVKVAFQFSLQQAQHATGQSAAEGGLDMDENDAIDVADESDGASHKRLAGIDGSVNITDWGGLVTADDDVVKDDLWEGLGQPGPDDQAAEKTNPAAHILEFLVQRGGRFAKAVTIYQHGQAGERTAIRADGNGCVKTEFLAGPARVALGDVIGCEGHK